METFNGANEICQPAELARQDHRRHAVSSRYSQVQRPADTASRWPPAVLTGRP